MVANRIKVPLKCDTRSEFIQKFGSVYTIAVRNIWLEEICSHMTYLKIVVKRFLIRKCP